MNRLKSIYIGLKRNETKSYLVMNRLLLCVQLNYTEKFGEFQVKNIMIRNCYVLLNLATYQCQGEMRFHFEVVQHYYVLMAL